MMKTRALYFFVLVTFSGVVNVGAAGWEEIWQSLSQNKTIAEDQLQTGKVYSMDYTFTISDGDGISGNFSDSDQITMSLKNTYSGEAISFTGNKQQLIDFAQANKESLLKIVFSEKPEGVISGVANTNAVSSFNVSRMYGSLGLVRNNDIALSAQYDFFEFGPEDIEVTGSSGLISYRNDIGEPGKHALSLEIPYRILEADDKVSSEMIFALISVLWEYADDFGDVHTILTAGPSVGATYLKSDFFPDGGGYLQYGGLIEGALSRALVARLTGKVGLSYQYLERSIPSDLVTEELKWLADAFNEAPADQTITPSVGLTFSAVPETLDLDFSVARVHQIGGGVLDEFKNQTIVTAFGTLTVGKFRGQLGYQTSFEIEDYSGYSIIASIRYLW